jgi:hypothetical protein
LKQEEVSMTVTDSPRARLGVRWTMGNVSDRGFEALRLSVWGAHKVFGEDAAYAICLNTVPIEVARRKAGPLPEGVVWHDVSGQIPAFLAERFDDGIAEGVGWKLAPLRLYPDRFELSLDNDCILWSVPDAVGAWLASGARASTRCLMAEDVKACFGQFAPQCGPEARNAGIRGLPPGLDLEAALREAIARCEQSLDAPMVLRSELDEQGLQTAALSLGGAPVAVSLADVTICSPFHPHLPHLGRCGAHFVGLNARHIPWDYYDRPADDCIAEHWARHRARLYERTGAREL